MSFDTFKKCVMLFKQCENHGKLYLHNFGEPLLHPLIYEFIEYANSQNVECSFFTNGINIDGKPFGQEVYRKLRMSGMKSIDFSAHILTEDQFKNIVGDTLVVENSFIPLKGNLGNWGGQIEWIPSQIDNRKCLFEKKNCFVVLWDGSISACCIDVEGMPKKQHVDDLLRGEQYIFNNISLCRTCYAMRGDEYL